MFLPLVITEISYSGTKVSNLSLRGNI